MKVAHLKRYKDLLYLFAKYGDADLVQAVPLEEALVRDETSVPSDGKPEAFAKDLEAMGPTYIKLGQLLSTRADLLPPAYLEALGRLQDKVEPFSFEDVEAIVTEELGVRLSKAFDVFEDVPLAAASLGQVHRATLRDGRQVAVKVQRPGIRARILKDLDALHELADLLDQHTDLGRRYAVADVLEEFRKTLLRELDYRQEAENLKILGANLSAYDRIVVPQPVVDYSSSRVLTMDYISGRKVTAISPLRRLELDGAVLAETLFKAYLDQVLVDGFFHADPHPGNVFVTDDRRVALLDLGMVARVDPEVQERLVKLMLAISDGNGREAAERAMALGTPLPGHDAEDFTRRVSDVVVRYHNANVEEIQVGRIMVELSRAAGQCGIRPAPELTLLGKTLLNLDEVARTLEPSFNPNALIRRHVSTLMERHMLKSLSPRRMISTVLEMNELVQKLPGRLNTLLDTLSDGAYTLRVSWDEGMVLMKQLHRMANRLSLSLVLAALIIGAAMMMRVETAFTILGYPGIAMLLFLVAVACGFVLVVSIILSERQLEK